MNMFLAIFNSKIFWFYKEIPRLEPVNWFGSISAFSIMNFFETCHGQCGYPQGSPQPVSKIWDDFHFHDFMGSPLWSLELDLWIIHWKNPNGGPHEILKMKILPYLWYLLWWTLSVPTLSMTSFKINHYWKGWNAPKSVYRLKSRYLLFH